MDKLEYTQHSVAWPKLVLPESWHKDEIGVTLETGGEMKWIFMEFGDGGGTGVQMSVFGDSLHLLFDERIQKVIADWRSLSSDDITPSDFIKLLDAAGAVPSAYHSNPNHGAHWAP
jgi:hypothetical protein